MKKHYKCSYCGTEFPNWSSAYFMEHRCSNGEMEHCDRKDLELNQ